MDGWTDLYYPVVADKNTAAITEYGEASTENTATTIEYVKAYRANTSCKTESFHWFPLIPRYLDHKPKRRLALFPMEFLIQMTYIPQKILQNTSIEARLYGTKYFEILFYYII